MDFLEIRRKARQRAEARAREAPGEKGAPEAAARGPAAREAPARDPREDPVLTDADVLEGRLIAELQGAPPAAPPADERFRIAARGPAPEGAGAEPRVGPPPISDPLEAFFYRPDEPEAPLLVQGLEEAPRPPASEAEEERREYLAFFLGEEEYALELSCLREIVRAPVITEVPRAPEGVLGVVTVRGEVLPVLDTRKRLGLPEPDRGRPPRVIVCDGGGGPVGLLVDGVSQVVRLAPSTIEPRPRGIGGAAPGFIAGIGRDRDRLFILLDPRAVLEAPATRAARPEAGA